MWKKYTGMTGTLEEIHCRREDLLTASVLLGIICSNLLHSQHCQLMMSRSKKVSRVSAAEPEIKAFFFQCFLPPCQSLKSTLPTMQPDWQQLSLTFRWPTLEVVILFPNEKYKSVSHCKKLGETIKFSFITIKFLDRSENEIDVTQHMSVWGRIFAVIPLFVSVSLCVSLCLCLCDWFTACSIMFHASGVTPPHCSKRRCVNIVKHTLFIIFPPSLTFL